jgi:hypothetical protein
MVQDEEPAYQPQYFKFDSLNPLSVRTKIRALQQQTLLEACIENCTKASPLLLAYVRFDAAPGVIAVAEHGAKSQASGDAAAASQTEVYADSVQVDVWERPSTGHVNRQ